MRIGLHAIGVGTGARREVIDAVAVAAEARGVATLWAGEHAVMVDDGASAYPYSDDGRIAVPATADWLDPFITLSFAAAATEHIRLATGVLLLAEHNPVLVAKTAASLDALCGGRFSLGIGVGWSREEYAALGIPFERRGTRVDEYCAVMRTIWSTDPASFDGEFVSFSNVRVRPKPFDGDSIPLVIGGNSDAALHRVATIGDGWYGFNLDDVSAVEACVQRLRGICEASGRDVAELDLAVSLARTRVGDLERLADLGIDELVLVAAPPLEPTAIAEWLDRELQLVT